VQLLHQRRYSVDWLVVGHADPGQAGFLQLIDSVGHGGPHGHFSCSWLLHPGYVVLREAANEGVQAGLMVFIAKPRLVPSFERKFQRKIRENVMWVSLDADATNDFPLSSTQLAFQK
jgi:hypothetical protein